MEEKTPAAASHDPVAVGRGTITTEIEGLQRLRDALADDGALSAPFRDAVETIRRAQGRVVCTGMGKSGHIARKIAATLASTGQPASYVHPGEASHGDLGMIEDRDIILALSNSGETPELADLLAYSHRFRIPLIAITSGAESTLAKASSTLLLIPKVVEACRETSAPTTSTTVALALGDALAVALLEGRGFTKNDFRTFHPGGKLGAQLRRVGDLLPEGRTPPLIPIGSPVLDAITVMTGAGLGCVGVADQEGALAGIITDGDLRRHAKELSGAKVEEVMTTTPRTVGRDTLAADALHELMSRGITALFVVEEGKPVAVLHVHDLLRQGVL
jgi:arabinose-5-phosphate isomerase